MGQKKRSTYMTKATNNPGVIRSPSTCVPPYQMTIPVATRPKMSTMGKNTAVSLAEARLASKFSWLISLAKRR